MRTLEEFREAVSPLQPATKVAVEKMAGDFLKQLKGMLPNPVQFQQGMQHVIDILSGKDPRSQIILRQVMTQPTTPTGAYNPVAPKMPVGTPAMTPPASVGFH